MQFHAIISGFDFGFTNGDFTPSTIGGVSTWYPWLIIEEKSLEVTTKIDPIENEPEISPLQLGILDVDDLYVRLNNRNGFKTILMSSISLSDTVDDTFSVRDTSGLSASDYIWIGQECIKVSVEDGTTLKISERAAYNTYKQYHQYIADGAAVYIFSFPYKISGRLLTLYCDGIIIYKGIIEPTETYDQGAIWMNVSSYIKVLQKSIFSDTPPEFDFLGFAVSGTSEIPTGGVWNQFEIRVKEGIYYREFCNVELAEKYETRSDLLAAIRTAFVNGFWDGTSWSTDFNGLSISIMNGKTKISFYHNDDNPEDFQVTMDVAEYSMLRLLGFEAGQLQASYEVYNSKTWYTFEAENSPASWGMIIKPGAAYVWSRNMWVDTTLNIGTQIMLKNDDEAWAIIEVTDIDGDDMITFKILDYSEKKYLVFTSETSTVQIVKVARGTLKGVIQDICDDSDGTCPEIYTTTNFDLNSFANLDTNGYSRRTYYLTENDNLFDILQNELKLVNAMLIVNSSGQIAAQKINDTQYITTELDFDIDAKPSLSRVPPLTKITFKTNYNYAKDEYEKPDMIYNLTDKMINTHCYPVSEEVKIKGLRLDRTMILSWLTAKASNRFLFLGSNLYQISFNSPVLYQLGKTYTINSFWIPSVINTAMITSICRSYEKGYNYEALCFLQYNCGLWAPACLVTSFDSDTKIATCADKNIYTNTGETDLDYFDPLAYNGATHVDIYTRNSTTEYSNTVTAVNATAGTLTFSSATVPSVPFLVTLREWTDRATEMEKFAYICDEDDRLILDVDQGYSWGI